MTKLFDVQAGNFSFYVVAADEEQAMENVIGIEAAYQIGLPFIVTGSTLEKPVEATDEAVVEMLGKGRLH